MIRTSASSLLVALVASGASAQECVDLLVENPSFEDAVSSLPGPTPYFLSNGEFSVDPDCDPEISAAVPAAPHVPGWASEADSDGGVHNPTAGDFNDPLPDGETYLYVNRWICDERPTYSQILGDVLEPGFRYVLSVAVGDRVGHPFVPAEIELSAGGAVETASVTSLADGRMERAFVLLPAVGTVSAVDPDVGASLEITLRSIEDGANGHTTFDDVRLCKAAAPDPVVPFCSEFSSGIDGWSLVDAASGSFTHQGSGGNPSGYVEFQDQLNDKAFLAAPSGFYGDWSGLDGGQLTLDVKVLDLGSGPTAYQALVVRLESLGGMAAAEISLFPFADPPAVFAAWEKVIVPLEESAWTLESGTWEALLDHVTKLEISSEIVTNEDPAPGETTGFDNICLPEPGVGSSGLSGVILVVVLSLARRKGHRRS